MSGLRDSLLGKEESIVPDMSEYCPAMSYKSRLYAFGFCIGTVSPLVLLLGAAGSFSPFSLLFSSFFLFFFFFSFFSSFSASPC